MNVGVDVSPLAQTGAGTARHVRGLLDALEGRQGLELHRLAFGGSGKATTIVRDAAWERGAQGYLALVERLIAR